MVCLAAPQASAQIVNTLSGFQDRPGWSGRAEASFSRSGGNTDLLTLGTGFRIQWKSAPDSAAGTASRHRVRLLGAVSRSEAGGKKTADASMGHLRYNYRLTPWVATLSFLQAQQDAFQRLRSRYLAGAGLRFDLVHGAAWRLSFGTALPAQGCGRWPAPAHRKTDPPGPIAVLGGVR